MLTKIFSVLFSTDGFVSRSHCGSWSTAHVSVAVLANLLIFIAYLCIPITIEYFLRVHKHALSGIARLFQLFILSCGLTHLLDACMFFHPMYRLDTLIKVVTAILSVYTAGCLLPLLPRLLSLPSVEQLREKIEHCNAVERELRHTNRDLKYQLLYRSVLEQELEVMRSLAHNKNHQDIANSLMTLDNVCTELKQLIPPRPEAPAA